MPTLPMHLALVAAAWLTGALSLSATAPGAPDLALLTGPPATESMTVEAPSASPPTEKPGLASTPLPRLARIQGRVVDEETGVGVEAVTIELRETERVQVSGAGGRFAFDRIPPGDYVLGVTHLAYTSVSVPISITETDAIYQVEIRIAPEAIALEPLVVEVRRAGIQGTDRDRIEWMGVVGLGTSFDRAAIDASGAIRVSHLISRIPGVQLRTMSGRTFGSELRLVPQQDCAPSVYIDGIRSPLFGASVDDLVSLGEVESMEVYRRLSELPGEFADDVARRCGAVIIATRRGWQPGEVFGWRRMVVLTGFVTVSYLLGAATR
ncbi:MAG: hypothetical protein EA350_16425 [Gemmatimonadales bacterium]|nr:MAG: hypothetical protein EA350_16425 [Gemmatimonadales bacterium]